MTEVLHAAASSCSATRPQGALKRTDVETVAISSDHDLDIAVIKDNKDGIKFPGPCPGPKLDLFRRIAAIRRLREPTAPRHS